MVKEADVQKTVIELLERHPKVAWVGRFNSGKFAKSYGGKKRIINANNVTGCSDVLGQLKDGRLLAMEVKKPGWKTPTDEREKAQAEFLALVDRNGGVSGFVRSVDDVLQILECNAI